MGTVSHTTGLVAIYSHEFSGVNKNNDLLLLIPFSLKVSEISQARFAFCRFVDPGMATSHVPLIIVVVVVVVSSSLLVLFWVVRSTACRS